MCVIAGSIGAAVAGSVVTSALSSGSSSEVNPGASQAAAAADPFASQRGQYQGMLSNLINNPSSITNQPGYQFGLTQSNNAVQGAMASNGLLNSGNVLTALQNNTQQYAGTALNNQELLLAQLAGANVGSPGTAGQILQGQNLQNQQSASALGNQVGGIVSQGINAYGNSGGNYFSGGNPFDPGSSYGVGGNTYGFSGVSSDPSYGVSYGFGS